MTISIKALGIYNMYRIQHYLYVYIYIYDFVQQLPQNWVEIHHIPCLNQVKLLFGVVIPHFQTHIHIYIIIYISHISIIRFPYHSIPMTDLNSKRNDHLFVRLGTNVQPQFGSLSKRNKKRHSRISKDPLTFVDCDFGWHLYKAVRKLFHMHWLY